ncbi:MAG TPA: hypothetical protein VGI90_05965 [Steroidobacteraceae bacterium]|jgi:hypothetical protein
MNAWRIALLIAALGIAACASTVATKPSGNASGDAAATTPSISIDTQRRLNDALNLIESKDLKRGAPALHAVIEEKQFETLSRDTQYRALVTAAKVAVAQGELKLAYQYLTRINSMPEASFGDAVGQSSIALKISKDRIDATVLDSLTAAMKRWPEHVADINVAFIGKVLRDARKQRDISELPLLQALYDAHWKLKGDLEPSWAWEELAVLLTQNGRLSEALDVSKHITDPYDLIGVRSDRRLDALVAANPSEFDVDAAAEREFDAIELAVAKAPRSLELKLKELAALEYRLHYGAMLAAADAVVSQVESTNYPEKLYDDYDKEYAWVLNKRSYALLQEGRPDDAIAQLARASLRLEDNGGNVSQTINLASLFCDLERPRDALKTLDGMTGKPSTFGNTQAENVRFCAANRMGDKKEMARSLKVLQENHEDTPFTYLGALLEANDSNRASKFLIAQLKSPETRRAALQSVQDYEYAPQPPSHQQMLARWRALIARADVKAAIEKVGRVESYRLEPPEYLQ